MKGGERLYIPEFIVGFVIGAVVAASALITFALVAAGKDDDREEK